MNTTTILRAEAIRAITDYREMKQASLDADAASAKSEALTDLRAKAVEGLDPGTPQHAVGALVAQTLSLTERLNVELPEETRAICRDACAAGVLKKGYPDIGSLEWYSTFSGITARPQTLIEAQEKHNAAEEYRDAQCA